MFGRFCANKIKSIGSIRNFYNNSNPNANAISELKHIKLLLSAILLNVSITNISMA